MNPEDFLEMFTQRTHVIFAFHGYLRIIHDLAHGRPNPDRFHVRGYMEEGTTTTPFDMVVANNVSRYHLAIEALRRVPKLGRKGERQIEHFEAKLDEHHLYIRDHFEDMPEIRDWVWSEP
jgi:xylulose-5-phosphate/fructose-6-phosphate phosphoketolase